MAWIAPVVMGAVSLISSQQAAGEQKSALGRAGSREERMFNRVFESLAPYRELGEAALPRFMSLLGLDAEGGYDPELADRTLRKTPGFQEGLETGAEVVEGGAAARSGLLSGRAGKELFRFGVDYSQKFRGTELDRLQNAINIGRGAGTETNVAQLRLSENLANLDIQRGNVGAQQAANVSNIVQGAYGNYQYQQRLNQLSAPAA